MSTFIPNTVLKLFKYVILLSESLIIYITNKTRKIYQFKNSIGSTYMRVFKKKPLMIGPRVTICGGNSYFFHDFPRSNQLWVQ